MRFCASFLLVSNRRNTILNLLLCSPTNTYCHLHCADAHQLIFHNQHTFKWLLVLIDWFSFSLRRVLNFPFPIEISNNLCPSLYII